MGATMKLTKPFLGVPKGEIYPRQYQAGDECPPELLAAARELEAVEQEKKPAGGAKAKE